VRFGLIGTGYWAREIHAAGLQAHPDSELVGVWGRSPDKAAALAGDLGVPSYNTLAELLADVEAVAIAVPPHAQAEFAVEAAQRGVHLLLDKPLALDVAAADRVVAAVERAGVGAAVFFTMRYTENVAIWLDEVAGEDWYSARVRIYTSIFEPGSPYAESVWRQERGALWDIGPHALSIALPLLGPAQSVIAQPGRGDAVDIGLRHTGGATSLLSLSLTAPEGARGSEWHFLSASSASALPTPATTPLEAFVACIDDLLGAVRDGRPSRCTVQFARDVVEILAAAEQALLAGGAAVGQAADVTDDEWVGMGTGSDAGAPGDHRPDGPLSEDEQRMLAELERPAAGEPLAAVEDSPEMVQAAEDDSPLPDFQPPPE
jgi:GFO/IDH/MocA oxidoreductase family protein